MMKSFSLLAGAVIALTALGPVALPSLGTQAAFAQDKPAAPAGPPVRLRAKVKGLDGQTLLVHGRDGKDVSVTLAPDTRIAGVAKRRLSDIKPNDFVGAAAVPGKDGKLHALEVHIFPEAMRGAGEGFRPFDLAPNSTMTNGAVSGMAKSHHGRTLTITYKGGTQEITVDPKTPIVALVEGDKSLLKPGAAIVLFGVSGPDNAVIARAITAEKNGVKPPM